jgi:hypothetical protein
MTEPAVPANSVVAHIDALEDRQLRPFSGLQEGFTKVS